MTRSLGNGQIIDITSPVRDICNEDHLHPQPKTTPLPRRLHARFQWEKRVTRKGGSAMRPINFLSYHLLALITHRQRT